MFIAVVGALERDTSGVRSAREVTTTPATPIKRGLITDAPGSGQSLKDNIRTVAECARIGHTSVVATYA